MAAYETWKETFAKLDPMIMGFKEGTPRITSEDFEALRKSVDKELSVKGMESHRTWYNARDFMQGPVGRTLKSSLDAGVKDALERVSRVKTICSTWEGALRDLLSEEVWQEHAVKLPGMDWAEDLRVLEDDVAYCDSMLATAEDLNLLSLCHKALDWQCGLLAYEAVFAKVRGNTPLHYAAWVNADEIAAMLLEDDADVNAKNWAGDTALHVAVSSDAPETTAVLLEHDARLNIRNGNDVPETKSLRSSVNDVGLTTQMVNPSRPELNAHNGSTPLHLAAFSNAHEIVETLMEHGANLNALDKTDSTPLHVAAAKNAHAATRILLDHEVNINAKDTAGNTPLHYAVAHDAQSVIGMLIEQRADVNTINYDGETPLHLYAMYNEPTDRIVSMLLHYGADIDAKDYYGYTPLGKAARFLRRPKVRTLLGSGVDTADILMTMQENFGGIYWNRENRQEMLEIIRDLLDSGAGVNTEVSTWLRKNIGSRIEDSDTVEYEIEKFL